MNGMGYQMMMPVKLKNKWARATWRGSVPSATRAAKIAVMVVPILAPAINERLVVRQQRTQDVYRNHHNNLPS